MMKILRRIICLVLSFAIMISLTSFSPATVEAAGYKKSVSTTYTVKCGDNGYWGTNVVDVDMKGDTPLKVTLKIESFNKVSKDNSITLRQYNEIGRAHV